MWLDGFHVCVCGRFYEAYDVDSGVTGAGMQAVVCALWLACGINTQSERMVAFQSENAFVEHVCVLFFLPLLASVLPWKDKGGGVPSRRKKHNESLSGALFH